ncbi:RCC1 domain-containing protein [Bifidobacterium sp. ESL0822]|uniref:RCC1 domain-containing protein n=1 Tax=Bifidobacterium sp. ESL0822 TaxID=3448585 RepID=UPI004042224D
MHQGTRLRRASATTILLLGLLAGLGAATADADAPPSIEEGRQTPHTAGQTPGSAAGTPLPSPSPLETAPPLNPQASNPGTPLTPKDTTNGADPSPAKPSDKTDEQAAHTVRFDPADGSKPTQASVKTGTLATPPQHNPQRDGFRFDGWTRDGQPYDFQTPILKDTTLTAKWTKTTDWKLSPEHGPATGTRLTISPPDRQEPYYTSIQAAGDQTVGLTGDGRIHTWTQDHTPVQVPSPTQASDGFHYLQAAAGDQWQAALGSDQHIYTWDSQQSTPTILDTGQDTRFTSISLNGDRLLAVDRKGQVHAFQDSQKDSRDPNPKLLEQATTILPGKAQAVTAAASASRTLIVDSDGQAWTWETSSPGDVKPEPVRQDPGTRTVQAQALNQGFLLLDADGQAWYLADSTTNPTAVSPPEGMKASRITADKNQAIITDWEGRVWAWKPGGTPVRADNSSQPCTQAVLADGRITAVSRQGGLHQWSLDGQGRPGQPARLDTTQAPTLETASMDGQALTLTRNNDAWQTDIPAHTPGEATITITGSQDGQPFTRSLNYTVDQPLTRDIRQGSTHTVSFDTNGGSQAPQPQQVPYPYGRVQRPTPDPVLEGHQFDGWFISDIAYDFSKPVTDNLTLTAKWTPSTWTINPDKGSQFGNETTTITPPPGQGIKFNQISGSRDFGDRGFTLAVGSDGNAYAWGRNNYGQLGDGTLTQRNKPVIVKKPAGASADFTYVQVSAGDEQSLAVGSDGYVYAWGNNESGQLGNGSSGGYSTVPLRVIDPNDPRSGLTAVQVSAGYYHSLAIDARGNIWAWGFNQFGELGNGNNINSAIPTLAQYPRDAGTVTAIQVSGGFHHTAAIDTKGNTWSWGWNWFGQLGNGNNIDSAIPVPVQYPRDAGTVTAIQVSAGADHSLIIDTKGNTWAWGWNQLGELGNGSSSADANPVPGMVKYPENAGTVTAIQVSAGGYHSLAIDKNGNAWAWGGNDSGELGIGTTSKSEIPALVQYPKNAGAVTTVQVSAGGYHSLGIDKEGKTWAWGYNQFGQLGNGTISNSSIPTPVAFNLSPVISSVTFDTSPATNLNYINDSSVTVLTPEHLPGPVTVSVGYTLGGEGSTLINKSLTYTYLPAGVLPRAGGEGILLAFATGMTGMGGVLASRRHRREAHQLLHASHE